MYFTSTKKAYKCWLTTLGTMFIVPIVIKTRLFVKKCFVWVEWKLRINENRKQENLLWKSSWKNCRKICCCCCLPATWFPSPNIHINRKNRNEMKNYHRWMNEQKNMPAFWIINIPKNNVLYINLFRSIFFCICSNYKK